MKGQDFTLSIVESQRQHAHDAPVALRKDCWMLQGHQQLPEAGHPRVIVPAQEITDSIVVFRLGKPY